MNTTAFYPRASPPPHLAVSENLEEKSTQCLFTVLSASGMSMKMLLARLAVFQRFFGFFFFLAFAAFFAP